MDLGDSLPFTPIKPSVLIPWERIDFNLYIKLAQKGSQDLAHVPFLRQEEVWKPEWLGLLSQKGIERLYFLNEDLGRVIAYLNNHIQILSHASTKVSPELLTVFSEHLNFSIRRTFQSPQLELGIHETQNLVGDLTKKFQQDPTSIKLVGKILSHDYSIYNHSINVCLMGAAFMLYLKKSSKQSRALGLAGLLHDIGMTRIPQEIILKEGRLTPEERAEVNHHPLVGYRLLSKGTSQAHVPKTVLRLALEHHENADGSGYPQGLPLSLQHPWTRIIRLLDSYDSLTSKRPYRSAYKPFEAIKILQEMEGRRGPIYDQPTLKKLVPFLAPK